MPIKIAAAFEWPKAAGKTPPEQTRTLPNLNEAPAVNTLGEAYVNDHQRRQESQDDGANVFLLNINQVVVIYQMEMRATISVEVLACKRSRYLPLPLYSRC